MKEKRYRSPRFNTKKRGFSPGLTQKEITVLSMLGYGLSVKEISAAEKVGEKAIEWRRSNVADKLKLGSYSVADFARTALAFHLVSL